MLAQLMALLKALGPQAGILLQYLVDNKDQVIAIITLLTALLTPKTKRGEAYSAEQFIEECRKHGIATGDGQELLTKLPD